MAINGTSILLLVGTDVVGSQRGLTIDETSETIDVSSKESRYTRILSGRYASTLSLEALYVPTDTAYQALVTANRGATSVTVVKQESGTNVETASAFVTSISGDFPDQAEAVVSLELQVDGEWSAVTP